MAKYDERARYRAVIDDLVRECRSGQGTVLPGLARRGLWNEYAEDHPDEMSEERRMNRVLSGLSADDREIVARMLELSYEGAMPIVD